MRMENSHEGVIAFSQSDHHFFKRGVHAYQKKELSKAAKYIEKAVQLNPEEAIYYCQLALVYTDLAEYERSNELLQHILKNLDNTLYESYFLLANNYAYLGLFEKATEMATLYLHYEPEGEFALDTYELLDILHLEDEDTENPKYEDELILMYDQATLLRKRKKYREARSLLEKIIADYPSYWPAQNEKARMVYWEGETEKAIILTEQLWKESHYLPSACQLAVFYYEQGREKESSETAEVLKRLVPMDESHIYHVATALNHIGEHEEAYLFFKMYLSRRAMPDEDFFVNAGVAAYHTGRLQEALKWWEIAADNMHQEAKDLLLKHQNGSLDSQDMEMALSTFYKER